MHKYIRDKVNVGAVINTDVEALKAYKNKKKSAETLKTDIKQLQDGLTDIRSMIKELMSTKDKQIAR